MNIPSHIGLCELESFLRSIRSTMTVTCNSGLWLTVIARNTFSLGSACDESLTNSILIACESARKNSAILDRAQTAKVT